MEQNAWFDLPSEGDRLYWALAWAEKPLTIPKYVDLSPWLVLQDQGIKHTPSTGMACGNYWFVHATNCNNLHDNGGKQIDAFERWVRFLSIYEPIYNAEWVDPIKEGTAKQHHMDLGKKDKLILWYLRLTNTDEYEENLSRKRNLYTGSKWIDWKKTRESKDKIAVMWAWAAHLFFICWFDHEKRLLKCGNSTALKYYDEGYFYLRYEDIGCLYTVHALLDFDDQDVLDEAMEFRDAMLKEINSYISQGKPLKARHKIALRYRGLSSTM